ncbi:MAG: AsmA family protein [Gemmatimonadales bacterium]
MKPRRVSISTSSKGRQRRPVSDVSVPFDPDGGEFGHTERATLPPWREHPFAILAGAGLLAYVIGAIALQAFVDVDRVRTWVAPRASAALNRNVSISEGTVGLFPRPSVRLSDISIYNPEGFDGPTLARIDRVKLDLAWLPLFIGRVRVRAIRVDGAAVHLAIDEQGRSNFGDLVPKRSDADGAALQPPLAAALRRITVADASLTYLDQQRGRSMGVIGGDARMDLSGEAAPGGATWRADVTLDSDSLMVRADGLLGEIVRLQGPSGQLTARGGGAARGVEIAGGFVELAGDTLTVSGRLAGLTESQPSFELDLTGADVSARALTAFVPTELRPKLLPRAEGTLAVTLRLQGGLASSDRPTVDGTVRLDGVTLRLRGEPIAEGVDGVVAVSAERITVDSLGGTFAGGPFQLSGIVARDGRGTASVVAHARPDMDVLDRLGLLPPNLTVSGSAELDVSIAGPLEALDSLQVVGTTAFQGFQLEHDRLGAALYVPAGVVTWAGRGVSWSDLPMLLGSDRLTTSGELEDLPGFWRREDGTPRIHARFAGPSLDLDALFPPRPEEEPSYAELAFAHLSGRPVEGRDASVVAGDLGRHRVGGMPLLGSLELRFDTLSQGDHRLEEVVATVELTDSLISVSDASFGAWGGTARGSLQVAYGDARHQPFALSLRIDNAVASAFASSMAGGASKGSDALTGQLNLELEVTGSTDRLGLPVGADLAGHARVTVTDGVVANTGLNLALADFLESDHWSAVPFDRLSGGVSVHDGVLEILDGDLTGDLARVAFRGLVELTGATDVSMALAVPVDQLGNVSLRRTGIGASVVEQLRRSERPLDLGLHVSGPLGAPTLEPNGANAVELARR